MGWVSSPPNFSAYTKTVYDMANVDLKNVEAMQKARATPHRLDVVSESRPANVDLDPAKNAISTVNIDFATVSPSSENSHDQNPVVKNFKGCSRIQFSPNCVHHQDRVSPEF